jgi:hypothetical protein
MTALRLARIVGIALAFAIGFTFSQRATIARSGETVPGVLWAVGALCVFFLVGAIATEASQGPEADVRKDVLWGLGLGGILGIVVRLTAVG